MHLHTDPLARARALLGALYDDDIARQTFDTLRERLQRFADQHPQLASAPPPAERLTEDDVILIAYGGHIREPDTPPLRTLHTMLNGAFGQVVSGLHILPFYPYTSDDGFSVVDYTVVDPALGGWDDIAALGEDYRLMFDAVVNHISASSDWFQAFLRGEPGAEERFITLPPTTDVSLVTRPRTHPLLSRFETPTGPRWVWTTFSTDQIDLNFRSPDVLLTIIDVLLLYVHHGASLIRLDAIGYLWKELGTRCIHLPEAHAAVQLFRAALDAVAPGVLLITETNVPHADNISYFGDGTDEAQLVYQFPLAPLVLNAFASGESTHLNEWASSLAPPSEQTTFFNFLASHDGIGVVPATGILSQQEIDQLVLRTLARNGQVSYKTNSDGSQSPYELNITLFDALSAPNLNGDPHAVARFAAANAIMLALQGVPGIYLNSLIGAHNDHTGFSRTRHNRTLNREIWQRGALEEALANPHSHEHRIFAAISALIKARRSTPAFHPNAPQRVLNTGPWLFTLSRTAPGGESGVVCIHNLTPFDQPCSIPTADLPLTGTCTDLLTGESFPTAAGLTVALAPHQVRWLEIRG